MSKAFTKEGDAEEEDTDLPDALPEGTKNYMTPAGAAALREELRQLMREERPKIVEIVAWAASNGDRSENGDYLYGKKRLREIDRRARYLTKQLDRAEIVDPSRQQGLEKIFFGATVTFRREDGAEQTVQLVGIDEANAEQGKISWLSPVAKALMKKSIDDIVKIQTPAKKELIEVIDIKYYC